MSDRPPRVRDDAALPPHIVDCTMFWSPTGGGVRRYLLTKRAWLTGRAGWRHTLLAPGADSERGVDCARAAVPLPGGYRLPWRRKAAAAQLVALRPDLIEAGDPFRLAWSALDAGARLAVPTVAFCHSNLAAMAARLAGARWAGRCAGAYLGRLYRCFDLVLAPSRAMADELRELGVAGARQQPLGVDCELFHPRRRDPEWRERLNLPAGTRLLVYAGRFAPEKNLPLLCAAVDRLGPPYLLLAVGAGPQPPVGRRVRILAHESRPAALARLVASADALVHAGDQETFGLTVLEAMACGTPVVVRAAAGLAELVAGGAGIAVPSARVDDWAEAIAANFAADKERRIARARARAESYDWQQVLPMLVQHYRRLLRDRRCGGRMVHEMVEGAL